MCLLSIPAQLIIVVLKLGVNIQFDNMVDAFWFGMGGRMTLVLLGDVDGRMMCGSMMVAVAVRGATWLKIEE